MRLCHGAKLSGLRMACSSCHSAIVALAPKWCSSCSLEERFAKWAPSAKSAKVDLELEGTEWTNPGLSLHWNLRPSGSGKNFCSAGTSLFSSTATGKLGIEMVGSGWSFSRACMQHA